MLQTSKILKSREDWKNKAIQRSYEIRELRKTQQRHLKTILELKRMNRELIQVVSDKKKDSSEQPPEQTIETTNTAQIIHLSETQQVRSLCVLLAINAVVSYRSIPRILELFKLTGPNESNWAPNFTSIINWTLRLGLGLLKQVKTISEPWVAIIDHSIDIGTKKVLVVLRVPVEALSKRGSAIRLQDCECIGLSVSEKVTGKTISPELEKIFAHACRQAGCNHKRYGCHS